MSTYQRLVMGMGLVIPAGYRVWEGTGTGEGESKFPRTKPVPAARVYRCASEIRYQINQ
jgi:hypothetical protein